MNRNERNYQLTVGRTLVAATSRATYFCNGCTTGIDCDLSFLENYTPFYYSIDKYMVYRMKKDARFSWMSLNLGEKKQIKWSTKGYSQIKLIQNYIMLRYSTRNSMYYILHYTAQSNMVWLVKEKKREFYSLWSENHIYIFASAIPRKLPVFVKIRKKMVMPEKQSSIFPKRSPILFYQNCIKPQLIGALYFRTSRWTILQP